MAQLYCLMIDFDDRLDHHYYYRHRYDFSYFCSSVEVVGFVASYHSYYLYFEVEMMMMISAVVPVVVVVAAFQHHQFSLAEQSDEFAGECLE